MIIVIDPTPRRKPKSPIAVQRAWLRKRRLRTGK